MRIVFAGTPEFAAVALKALLKTNHEIIAVYTQPDRKSGRGQKVTQSAVKKVAQEANLPIYQPLNFKSSTELGLLAQKELKELNADLMIVAAYGLILPQVVLDTPQYGCINIHASLLPRWRGAAPIHRAIEAGDIKTGITIMKMAAGLDTGDMIYKTNCDIKADDTSSTLHDKLAVQGAEAICDVLKSDKIFINLLDKAEKQNDSEASYAHKITKTEAEINFQLDAHDIEKKIRAFNPWPVSFVKLNDKENLRVWSASAINIDSSDIKKYRIGEIIEIDKTGIKVKCGNNSCLLLTTLQWPGGKPLNSLQIQQANKLQVGQQL